ncbi:hypothetical protein GIB67_009821 [Kingdonia uniflora]|uniref:Cytochrome P450 n=1 Tax=Kingdonia uniflora TaxID=39325 RepID=A0A7J7LMT6_9MAGN|nr:hypothetical protein GIB67_009821 [Kingdonia uniflora]
MKMVLTSTYEFHLPLLALVTLGSLYFVVWYLNFKPGKKLLPGSLGYPLIGESIGFLRALKKDACWEWIESHVQKYGPVFKSSLMGKRVAVLTGPAGTKFILSTQDGIVNNQSLSASTIFGKKCLLEFEGSRHKLLKGAMMNMLRPERLQKVIGEMDSIVQRELLQELKGKDSVQFVTLISKIVFSFTCTILFRLPEGGLDNVGLHVEDLRIAARGILSIPLNIPGSTFRKACQARARICKVLSHLIETKKAEMEKGKTDDIVTSFLNVRDEVGKPVPEEEIIDNLMLLLIASNDTTTSLLTLFLRYLGRDAHVYNKVVEEQKEVYKMRVGNNDGKIQWSEIQSMKYTWSVAQEVMRLTPPAGGTTRRTTKDISFAGFDIPKGWRLLWLALNTNMDAKFFEEPEKFDPSRFEKSPSKSAPPPYTYLPFGAGMRICPGSEFARVEILLIIHYLIINYQWTPMILNEPIASDPNPFPAMGLPVKLHPRLI